MQRKRIHILTLTLLTLTLVLGLAGCGKSGVMKANLPPSIEITSYEGFDDSDLLSPYVNTEFVFQQKIYWHATDPDGVIAGFAYRILDQSNNPIATPGNHFIDLSGDITPQNVIDKYGLGWVMHYMPNANQDIPLDDPQARRSIWTNQKYAVINFPAADANGNPLVKLSKFEVIAIDNRGEVTQTAAWRKFNASSARPVCTVSTTKGNPNGGEVGSGIRLSFTMRDFDPFVPEIPFKFEFKMMKVNKQTGLEIAGTSTDWLESNSPNDRDINNYLLTRYTNPALSYDINEAGDTLHITKIYARSYDMAGVVSSVSDSSSIKFAVKAGFRPKTLIYKQKVYALGDNHFVDYSNDESLEIYPFTIVGGSQRFASPFFQDLQNKPAVVYSQNMKIWIRWGWHGEYGKVQAQGPILYTDNPYDKKVDTVLDRTTSKNYFSEITHFDIRFDGAEYDYAIYHDDPSRYVTDADTGKKWLRVPLYSPLGQTVVLTYPKINPGTHTFEVRCVDLQGEHDPVPAVFEFKLDAPIVKADRQGVLVIDDDSNHDGESPEVIVNQKYANMLSDFSGPVDFIKRSNNLVPGDTYKDQNNRHIASTDLQKYKLVIYHSDMPSENGFLTDENDGFVLYMKNGGNLLISHTSGLSAVLQAFVGNGQKSFLSYLGIPFKNNPVKYLSDSFLTRPLFQKAIGQATPGDVYPDIQVAYQDHPVWFNTLVNLRHGLSRIAYFEDDITDIPGNKAVYRLGAKPVNYPTFPPTQADYDRYNNKPIGIRKTNPNGRTWLFGFPLSYMADADAKAMMNKVLSEI